MLYNLQTIDWHSCVYHSTRIVVPSAQVGGGAGGAASPSREAAVAGRMPDDSDAVVDQGISCPESITRRVTSGAAGCRLGFLGPTGSGPRQAVHAR